MRGHHVIVRWHEIDKRLGDILPPSWLVRISTSSSVHPLTYESDRIIVCANIPSMDNAAVATIVADIEYTSEVADGTFIRHEDPTC